MNKKSTIFLSFLAGILVCIIVPILLLSFGAVNVGADVEPGAIEQTLASWALDGSVERRAPKERNPFDKQPAAIAVGLDHYRENCVICHGAPGVAGTELSKGLNPPAPSLSKAESGSPDGELFWIIKHGLRMTPMPAFGPTHSDEEIWKLVAFIRHLPNLTSQEQESLRTAASGEAHHHEEQIQNAPEKPAQSVSPPAARH